MNHSSLEDIDQKPRWPEGVAPLYAYLAARDGPPEPRGMVADVVIDGAGLYLAAAASDLTVRVRLAHALVPGLPVVQTGVELRHGLIANALWQAIVDRARAAMPHEILVDVVAREAHAGEMFVAAAGPYTAVEPQMDESGAGDWQPQQSTNCSVRATPVSDAVLEIHSHQAMPAYFSATDDRDETGRRIYGVLGRLDSPQPELAFRVATGCNPPAMERVPFGQVFEAEPGAFRDVNFQDRSLTVSSTDHSRLFSHRRLTRSTSLVATLLLELTDDVSAIRYVLERGRGDDAVMGGSNRTP